MKQTSEKDNNANEEAMLDYVSDKYGIEFNAIEYIPAERGFNDFMEENILTAKSEDGIVVNVKEKLGKKGEYYDDYINNYASNLLEGKVDYQQVENLHVAKSYVALRGDSITFGDLKDPNFTLSNDNVFRNYNLVLVTGEANEKVLEDLYDVYLQIQELGFEKFTLLATFSVDVTKSESYVNNLFLYGTQKWEEYDDSMNAILRVNEAGLSMDEFKNQLTLVQG